MNDKNMLVAGLLSLVISLTMATACTSAPSAQFEITSLLVKPTEVAMGEKAIVSAQVTNNGGTEGIYGVTLSVDGKKIETKAINLGPGYTQTVTFSLSKDEPGAYKIGIGEKSATLTVKSKLVAEPMELQYDDSIAKDCLSLVKPCTGYSVEFVAPPDPFTINKIRVFGLVYGSPGFHIQDSELQIWDKDQKVLYSTPFTGDEFPLRTRLGDNIDSTGAWVSMEIPDVKVEGNFYVHIYTGSPSGQGFRMGASNTRTNTHSDVTVRDANGVDSFAPNWPYSVAPWFGDRSRVNWMVRVSGNAMVPQE